MPAATKARATRSRKAQAGAPARRRKPRQAGGNSASGAKAGLPRWVRDHGLSLILLTAFAAALIGQALTGLAVENGELRRHGETALSLGEYLVSGAFLSAMLENWESEFLQMAVYVVLTAMLFQRGSAESRDPDHPDRPGDEGRGGAAAPRLAKTTGILRWLYANSLGLTLGLLFLLSFLLHWITSAKHAAEQALEHGEAPPTLAAHLLSAQLWFESFQNWQSEFLATALLALLTIWLRQRGSPESKPVTAPHRKTGK